MSDAPNSRRNILEAIKSAEKAGIDREDSAKAKAARQKTATQAECAVIVEQAEKEGRLAMRAAVESAKAGCAATKDAAVEMSLAQSMKTETASLARMPEVARLMHHKFKKEFDVKD